MDNRQHTNFDMGTVLNKLRTIANEDAPEPSNEIDSGNYTKIMSRLVGIKDAIPQDEFNSIRAGIRSLSTNQRPNPQAMMALMNFLEKVLSYVAEDQGLYARLKADLGKGSQQSVPAPNTPPAEVGAPAAGQPEVNQAAMRGLK